MCCTGTLKKTVNCRSASLFMTCWMRLCVRRCVSNEVTILSIVLGIQNHCAQCCAFDLKNNFVPHRPLCPVLRNSMHVSRVAVCCGELQWVALCFSELHCYAACCSLLQCAVVCCSVLQRVAACCSRALQCVAACCSVLQCHWVFPWRFQYLETPLTNGTRKETQAATSVQLPVVCE